MKSLSDSTERLVEFMSHDSSSTLAHDTLKNKPQEISFLSYFMFRHLDGHRVPLAIPAPGGPHPAGFGRKREHPIRSGAGLTSQSLHAATVPEKRPA